jgi:hypothetical protein
MQSSSGNRNYVVMVNSLAPSILLGILATLINPSRNLGKARQPLTNRHGRGVALLQQVGGAAHLISGHVAQGVVFNLDAFGISTERSHQLSHLPRNRWRGLRLSGQGGAGAVDQGAAFAVCRVATAAFKAERLLCALQRVGQLVTQRFEISIHGDS